MFLGDNYSDFLSSNTTIQAEECQILDKIMKIGPNRVHIAPFGLILNQNRSHRVWDASGMPPGPWGPRGGPKKYAPQKIMKVGLSERS